MLKNKNTESFLNFRKKHPEFYYHGFEYRFNERNFEVNFHFSIGDEYHFHPIHRVSLPTQLQWNKMDAQELDQLVFHLGMVELVSYWKASCSPRVIIKPFRLSHEQIEWWKKLYFEGLGEFFYLNDIQISRQDFVEIVCESERTFKIYDIKEVSSDIVMVPVGGGKDSVVSLEVIKGIDISIVPMVVNLRGATEESIVNAGFNISESIITKRSIDPQLIALNQMGYLNGHTPFSAMLAFLSLMVSRMMGIKYVALSNESSANESTVVGTNINHQYSKSYEFENDFRSYYQKHLTKGQEYFSFLRPLSELQIACLFSRFHWHHRSFKSCNVGSKQNIWCGKCSKCLFTYILLSPFIPQNQMEIIFGKKLLNDISLKPIFEELRGQSATKPFECVGTIAEVELALNHAHKEYYTEVLMKNRKPQSSKDALIAELHNWNRIHFLPRQFEEQLKDYIERCWN